MIQLVLRDGEAKPMEVRCGISEALLIWHLERPMNIGALMQKVYDVEKRGLDLRTIRLHRFDRSRAYGASEFVGYSVVQLAKKQ